MFPIRKAEKATGVLGCGVKDLSDEGSARGGAHIGFRVEEMGRLAMRFDDGRDPFGSGLSEGPWRCSC